MTENTMEMSDLKITYVFWGRKSTDQGKVSRAVARTRKYTRHLQRILGGKSTDQGKVSRAVARTREYTRYLEQTIVWRRVSIRTEHTRHNCTGDRTRRRQTTVTERVTTEDVAELGLIP